MSNSGAKLPVANHDEGLSNYLAEINRFPLLSPEEEYMLAKRWTIDEDAQAAHKLVTSHLRLAAKIAMGYRGYGLPASDVIAEANIGLMQAVKRFDPDKGFRLATYAMWWIRASVQEFILRSWSLVKLGTTRAQKKLFFNLRKAKASIGVTDDAEMKPADFKRLSEMLVVSEEDIQFMNGRLSRQDSSLNAPVREDADQSAEHIDLLPDENADHVEHIAAAEEAAVRSSLLVASMAKLNDRERDILEKRKLSETPETLESLAQKYGVSRERIRQLEIRAFEKVRQYTLELAAERGLAQPAS